jgi:hypothetical protein
MFPPRCSLLEDGTGVATHSAGRDLPRVSSDATITYLNAAQVRTRYGGMSDMALWRWLHDGQLGFPKPLVITGRGQATPPAYAGRQAPLRAAAGRSHCRCRAPSPMPRSPPRASQGWLARCPAAGIATWLRLRRRRRQGRSAAPHRSASARTPHRGRGCHRDGRPGLPLNLTQIRGGDAPSARDMLSAA